MSTTSSCFQDSGLCRHSHPSTSVEKPKNQPCDFESLQSLMQSDHLRLTSLVIVYQLAHLFLLLLQAGDVETNPGPQTPGMPPYYLLACLYMVYNCEVWQGTFYHPLKKPSIFQRKPSSFAAKLHSIHLSENMFRILVSSLKM